MSASMRAMTSLYALPDEDTETNCAEMALHVLAYSMKRGTQTSMRYAVKLVCQIQADQLRMHRSA